MDQNKAVETAQNAAPGTEVETTVIEASQSQTDYQAELAQKDEELAQIRKERDNYRKGMLKAKGKLPEETLDNPVDLENVEPKDLDTMIDQKVQERLLAGQEAKLLKDKQTLLDQMAKENRELKIALANRSQISSGASGANQDTGMSVKDQFFSDAQLVELKKRGWDDKKIDLLRKNMVKGSRA